MTDIATAVAELSARPRPVVCLDTCVILDIVRFLRDGRTARVECVRRLFDVLALNPDRVRIVITSLVFHEWGQNIAIVRAEADRLLAATDERIASIHEAWIHIGNPRQHSPSTYSTDNLTLELENMANRLLAICTKLDGDNACTARALARVIDKRRPSQAGQVKDSIHLEHYLELTRRLRERMFAERCVFVSSNKDDFWENKASPKPHPDLQPDLDPIGFEFFGSLESALGSLRI